MQPRALLVAALLVLLVSARAQEVNEASLLESMKEYMQQAQEALTSVNVTEQASTWMKEGFNCLKDYWSTFTRPLSNFWSLAPGATPGTTPDPAV